MLQLLLSLFLLVRLTEAAGKNGRLLSLSMSTSTSVPRSNGANGTTPTGTISLRTMNYNVFGRWLRITGEEGQTERLSDIPKAIFANEHLGPGVDVITVEEAWCADKALLCGDNDSRQALIDSFQEKGWRYHSNILVQYGVQKTSGGVIIFSKWPIEESKYVSPLIVFVWCTSVWSLHV